MKAHDVADLATRNLRESKLRNSLTTLGIAVGVASLVAMLSLGAGLQQLATRRLTSSGLFDTIVVTSRRDFRGFGPRQPATSTPPRVLDEQARRELAALPKVVEVFPEMRFMTEVRYAPASPEVVGSMEPHPDGSAAGKVTAATVAGLQPSARQNESFEDMQGRFFSSPIAEEAILLADFAKELERQPKQLIGREIEFRYAERQPLGGGQASEHQKTPPSAAQKGGPPGRKDGPASQSPIAGRRSPEKFPPEDRAEEDAAFSIVRRTRKLRVVGIIEREPYGGFRGMAHAGVFIPMQLAEQLNVMQPSDLRTLAGAPVSGRTYMTLMVRVAGPAQVEQVQNKIKQMGFGTFSLLDATRNLRRFFTVLDLFLGIFGSLALAVAALGIVNTLVMAILERRREIGIMKAIGASDADVKRLFFAEAGAMGIAGGLGGVALGWAIGRVINYGTNIYLQRHQLPPENLWYVPWWLVAGAVAFSITVTLVAGLYPAARAARLNPVQALRYE